MELSVLPTMTKRLQSKNALCLWRFDGFALDRSKSFARLARVMQWHSLALHQYCNDISLALQYVPHSYFNLLCCWHGKHHLFRREFHSQIHKEEFLLKSHSFMAAIDIRRHNTIGYEVHKYIIVNVCIYNVIFMHFIANGIMRRSKWKRMQFHRK